MNTTDYAQISSSNIRFLLTKNNMSIRQLAEKIGIAATTLNDSLKSKKGVSVDSLIKIADYFNLTVNDLCNVSLDRKSAQDEDVVIIKEKLCGKEDFIINEAMTINMELFPDIPFKTLFSHYKND